MLAAGQKRHSGLVRLVSFSVFVSAAEIRASSLEGTRDEVARDETPQVVQGLFILMLRRPPHLLLLLLYILLAGLNRPGRWRRQLLSVNRSRGSYRVKHVLPDRSRSDRNRPPMTLFISRSRPCPTNTNVSLRPKNWTTDDLLL